VRETLGSLFGVVVELRRLRLAFIGSHLVQQLRPGNRSRRRGSRQSVPDESGAKTGPGFAKRHGLSTYDTMLLPRRFTPAEI
jgi:hypothetical protein